MNRFTIVALLSSACFADVTPDGFDQRLFPMSVGDVWIYKVGTEDHVELRVEGTTTRDGKTCFQIKRRPEFKGLFLADATYRITSQSVQILDCPPDIGNKSMTILKFPARKGRTWEERFDKNATTGCSLETKNRIESRVSITVPAGTFSCLHVHSEWTFANSIRSSSLNVDYYFAYRVGLVKMTVREGERTDAAELEKVEHGK